MSNAYAYSGPVIHVRGRTREQVLAERTRVILRSQEQTIPEPAGEGVDPPITPASRCGVPTALGIKTVDVPRRTSRPWKARKKVQPAHEVKPG